MRWFKASLSELFGLFVDDGNFAMASVVWIGVTWFLSVHILAEIRWGGVVSSAASR
jgi:hypothetical protein